jgi:hypothetical protein
VPPPTAQPEAPAKIPWFGARKRARDLAAELAQLRQRTAELGLLSIVELQERRDSLAAEIDAQNKAARIGKSGSAGSIET